MASTTANLHFGGVTIFGDLQEPKQAFFLEDLDGWDAFSAAQQTAARPNAHGQWASRAFVESKTVVAKGFCESRNDRNQFFEELTTAMAIPGSGGEPQVLRVESMGRDLFANATLTSFDPWDEVEWLFDGLYGWKIEFTLNTPLRYAADEEGEYTTGLDDGTSSGLEFDLFGDEDTGLVTGYLEFGEPNTSGRVVFENRGNTDAWPEFEVYCASPFRIVHGESGRTIEYSEAVPAGQTVTINQKTATALLQGTGDRSKNLTRREWFSIPAKQTGTIRFVTDTRYDPAAQMTVRIRSTYL